MVSLLTSSLWHEMIAEDEVEGAHEWDAKGKHRKCHHGMVPISQWSVQRCALVELSKIVAEDVQDAVPGHDFPVGSQHLDVCEVDIDPSHKQWCQMQK